MTERNTDTQPKHNLHLAPAGVLLLFLVSLWTAALYFVAIDREATIAGARQTAQGLTLAVEEQTRRQLRLVEAFLNGSRQWIELHPGEDPRVDPRFLALADEFRRTGGSGVGVGFVTMQGEYFSRGAEAAGPMLSQPDGEIARAGLAASGPQLYVGGPLRPPSGGRWGLPVALRLPANAANLAAAVAVIDLAKIETQVEAQRLAPTGTVALLRQDGTVLARVPRDEKLLGKSIAQGELFRHYLPQRARDTQAYHAAEFGNEPELVSYSALPDLPVVAVVTARIDDLLADWEKRRRLALIAVTALTIVALLAFTRLLGLLRRFAAQDDELRRLAITDSLTGALNHGSFMDMFEREFARSQRYAQPMAVMMLDIDFFKRINDGYGHAVGDEALRDLVRTLLAQLRNLDALGRLGGEEFAILLPNTPGHAAQPLADRLRERVAGIVVRAAHGEEVRFTISIGVTGIDAADTSSEQVLARADAALYQAKANGRNRVEFAAVDEAGRTPAVARAAAAPNPAKGA